MATKKKAGFNRSWLDFYPNTELNLKKEWAKKIGQKSFYQLSYDTLKQVMTFSNFSGYEAKSWALYITHLLRGF